MSTFWIFTFKLRNMAENKEREWDPRNTVEGCALRPREEKNLEKKIIGD